MTSAFVPDGTSVRCFVPLLDVPSGLARLNLPVAAVSVPAGLSDGLPVGLQLIAPALGEATMLRAAWAFEQDLGLPTRPVRPGEAGAAATGAGDAGPAGEATNEGVGS